MSAGTVFVCRVCSAPVCKPNNCRNLASASSESVALELKKLVEQYLPGAIFASDNGYACWPCFNRILKLLRLWKSAEDVEKVVVVNLTNAAHLYVPQHREEREGGSPSTPRASRRRLLEDPAESTPRSKWKRIRTSLDTPTRKAVDRLQPSGESPLVVVCCILSFV